MASILKRLLAGALALCCVASSAAAESLLRSDNILEARLGAERLVLAPHATKAATAYVGLGVSLYSNMLYRTAPLLAPGGGTLADTCQGTFAQRTRGNWGSTTPTLIDSWGGVMNAGGTSGTTAEGTLGVFMTNDPQFRFSLNSAANANILQLAKNPMPWLSAGTDGWIHVVTSWNTCSSPTYAVAYWAPEGGTWSRITYITGATAFNANTSNPATGPNNNAFSFGGDGSNVYLGSYIGETDDVILDLGINSSSTASIALNGSACMAVSGDTNPCIPAAALNAYYNAITTTPTRINPDGICSGLLGHQPAICFTTDGGGAYSPSISNFTTNQGYGGAFLSSTFMANQTAFGTAPFPVTGLAPGSVGQKWVIYGLNVGASYAALASTGLHTFGAGDLIVAVGSQRGTSATITCGSGWTTLWAGANANPATQNIYTAVCYKIATGSVDAATTFNTSDATTQLRYAVMDYIGADQTSPFDAFGVRNNVNSLTAQQMPDILTSYGNDLYVGILVDSSAAGMTVIPPTGVSLRAVQQANSGSLITVFDKVLKTSGVTSIGSATINTALSFQAFSIGIKPAGAALSQTAHGSVSFNATTAGFFHRQASTSFTSAQCWGGGAAGGGAATSNSQGGSGGGFTQSNTLTLSGSLVYFSAAGDTPVYTSALTTSGGAPSWINIAGSNAAPASAANGCEAAGATYTTAAATGTPGCASGNTALCIGSVTYAGGLGHNYTSGVASGGGGGGAGSGGNGGNAGTPPAAGSAGTPDGGAGGAGVFGSVTANAGQIPGGGGGGAYSVKPGGIALGGQISLSW